MVFTKKYVNHLVPALMNITNKSGSNKKQLEKFVRYEVDNALVSSAQGFAWSRALKLNLQSSSSSINNAPQNPSLPPKFSQNPNQKNPKRSKRLRKSRPKRNGGVEETTKETEEQQISQQLTNLRTLLPGGTDMGVNELLTEVGSYLVALEMQVNVLRCLVEKH